MYNYFSRKEELCQRRLNSLIHSAVAASSNSLGWICPCSDRTSPTLWCLFFYNFQYLNSSLVGSIMVRRNLWSWFDFTMSPDNPPRQITTQWLIMKHAVASFNVKKASGQCFTANFTKINTFRPKLLSRIVRRIDFNIGTSPLVYL